MSGAEHRMRQSVLRQSDCGYVLDWHVTYEFLGGRIIGGRWFFSWTTVSVCLFPNVLETCVNDLTRHLLPRGGKSAGMDKITSANVGCGDDSSTFPGLPSCSVKWGDWSSSPSLNIFCLVFVSTICCSCGYLKTLALWRSLQETSQIWPTGSHPQAVGPGRKSSSLHYQ